MAEAIVANPLLAYPAVVALQLRVMWKVWDYKDTTFGDTSYYFLEALKWAQSLHDDIIFSPLYTNYFGTFLWFVHDVPAAVMAHRLVVVFAATLLVLALGRALLGPALGLLVAVWWAVVPSNFNVDYEVHLFGVIPILAAALLLAHRSKRMTRGIAFAIFVGSTLLVRNEWSIATIIFAAALLLSEIRNHRAHAVPVSSYLRAYGGPLLVVALLALGVALQSPDHGRTALTRLHRHHRLNMCQVYAFNYQQRHPADFAGDPFTGCAPLMQREFGRPFPTFTEEIGANPRAVADFIAWNLELLPSGLQVALFGATSKGVNPGYLPVKLHRRYALVLSFLCLVIIGAGLLVLAGTRTYWRAWLRDRTWAVLALAAASTTAVFAILTQRPRSEYIYGLTISLMLLTGFCAAVILRRLGVTQWIPAIAVTAAALSLLFVPSYYKPGPRPVHDAVERLHGVRRELQRPGAVLVTSGFNFEICAYLAKSFTRHCSSPSWASMRSQIARGRSVTGALDDAKATVIYADPLLHTDPTFAAFLASPAKAGWRELDAGVGIQGPWSVLLRDCSRSTLDRNGCR